MIFGRRTAKPSSAKRCSDSKRRETAVVLDAGAPTDVEPDVSGPSCTIELELGLGDGRAGYLTTDLSYDYVRINADYRT